MSKQDRRTAIAAEVARRANESGVPAAKFVHLLRCIHADEGGPRTFYPVHLLDRSRTTDGEKGDLDRIIRSALEHGEPVELALDAPDCYVPESPPADYCEISGAKAPLIVLSERAANVLQSLVEPCGVPVPVVCRDHSVKAFQLTAEVDPLDLGKKYSSWDLAQRQRRASDIESYPFRVEQIGQANIFKVSWRILVLQPFVDAFRAAHLNGLKFRRIWPHTALEIWS